VQVRGFGLEIIGLLLVLIGSVILGVVYWRAKVLPRLVAAMLILAGPGGILLSVWIVGHIPSGPMLMFCCAWVALGFLLLTGRGISDGELTRVS
jgi:hypothetical protein